MKKSVGMKKRFTVLKWIPSSRRLRPFFTGSLPSLPFLDLYLSSMHSLLSSFGYPLGSVPCQNSSKTERWIEVKIANFEGREWRVCLVFSFRIHNSHPSFARHPILCFFFSHTLFDLLFTWFISESRDDSGEIHFFALPHVCDNFLLSRTIFLPCVNRRALLDRNWEFLFFWWKNRWRKKERKWSEKERQGREMKGQQNLDIHLCEKEGIEARKGVKKRKDLLFSKRGELRTIWRRRSWERWYCRRKKERR